MNLKDKLSQKSVSHTISAEYNETQHRVHNTNTYTISCYSIGSKHCNFIHADAQLITSSHTQLSFWLCKYIDLFVALILYAREGIPCFLLGLLPVRRDMPSVAELRGHLVRCDRKGTAGPAPVDTGSTVMLLPAQDLCVRNMDCRWLLPLVLLKLPILKKKFTSILNRKKKQILHQHKKLPMSPMTPSYIIEMLQSNLTEYLDIVSITTYLFYCSNDIIRPSD